MDRCSRGAWGRDGHAKMVQQVIAVAHPPARASARPCPGNTNDDAIDRPVALNLHPLAAPPRTVLAVATLGDNPLDTWQRSQPVAGRLDFRGLQNHLEAGCR